MAGESKTTTDHKTIKKWVETRRGKPAAVKSTESPGDVGMLRIDFPGYRGEGSLEEISWDDFFAKFDEKNLAFVYQDETSKGEESRFFKFVSRETAEHKAESKSHSKKTDEKAHTGKAEEKSHSSKSSEKAHASKSHK